ncbi:MAG: hypothetical protein GY711_15305 [bacterium]|nr:hypothetical protein [bacterium]
MKKQAVLWTLASAILSPFAAAQSLAADVERPDFDSPEIGRTLPEPPIDVDEIRSRMYYDRPDGETLWARGKTYKASFGNEGATYVPFLGSDAPQNYPVRMKLEEVSVGGVTIAHDSGARAERSGDRVTLDRGILNEMYELELEQVEQLFVIPAQVGYGDLELRLDVDTELEGALDASGLHFRGPQGGIDYGTVTIIDAHGTSIPGTIAWDGDDITIGVPASFANSASYPILVDPILTTFPVESLPNTDFSDPDAAYSDALVGGGYLVIYEERFSGGDIDLYSRAVLENGSAFSQGYVDMTDDHWSDPAVAHLNSFNRFMCVATMRPAGTSFNVIMGRGRTATTNSWSSAVPFSLLDTNDDIHPDIAAGTGFLFRIVWEEEVTSDNHNIMARTANSGASPFAGIQQLTNSANAKDTYPHIADDLDAASAEYPVVWQRRVNGNNDIYGAILPSIGEFPIDTGITSQIRPDVSPITEGVGNGYYVVTYAQDFGDFDVMMRAMTVNQTIDLVNLSVMENAFTFHQYNPRIASDGDRFLIGYTYLNEITSNTNLYLTSVSLVGTELCISERRVPLAWSVSPEEDLAIASQYAGGGDRQRFLTTWGKYDTDSDIFAAVYESPEALCHGDNYCDAEANSTGSPAMIAARGSIDAGQILTLAASGMPANQFGYFIASRNSGFIANPGGSEGNFCLGSPSARFNGQGQVLNSGLLGRFEVDIDTDVIPLTPPTAVVAGELWHFQAWYRDGQQSNFTDGLAITFE